MQSLEEMRGRLKDNAEEKLKYDKEKQKEICRTLRKKVREIDQRYRCVIVTETSYIAEEK